MTINLVPDMSVTQAEMNDYGYVWGGMLPLKPAMAKVLSKVITVYRLYSDDTEAEIDRTEDIDNDIDAGRNYLYGVEKVDWYHYLISYITNIINNKAVC